MRGDEEEEDGRRGAWEDNREEGHGEGWEEPRSGDAWEEPRTFERGSDEAVLVELIADHVDALLVVDEHQQPRAVLDVKHPLHRFQLEPPPHLVTESPVLLTTRTLFHGCA